jgi:hypothetical protein
LTGCIPYFISRMKAFFFSISWLLSMMGGGGLDVLRDPALYRWVVPLI